MCYSNGYYDISVTNNTKFSHYYDFFYYFYYCNCNYHYYIK